MVESNNVWYQVTSIAMYLFSWIVKNNFFFLFGGSSTLLIEWFVNATAIFQIHLTWGRSLMELKLGLIFLPQLARITSDGGWICLPSQDASHLPNFDTPSIIATKKFTLGTRDFTITYISSRYGPCTFLPIRYMPHYLQITSNPNTKISGDFTTFYDTIIEPKSKRMSKISLQGRLSLPPHFHTLSFFAAMPTRATHRCH